jgi:hypothetical protein
MYNNLNYNEPAKLKHPQTAWLVLISVLITAIVVGALVYIFQMQKIDALEKQMLTMNQVIGTLNNSLNSAAKVNTTTTSKTNILNTTLTTNVVTPTVTTSGIKLFQDSTNKVSFYYQDNNLDQHIESIDQVNDKTKLLSVLFLKEGTVYPIVINGPRGGPLYWPTIDFEISKITNGSGTSITQEEYVKIRLQNAASVNPNVSPVNNWETINGNKFLKIITDDDIMGKWIEYMYFTTDKVYNFRAIPYDLVSYKQVYDDLQTMLKTFKLE